MATFRSPKSVKQKPIKATKDILIYADFGCTTGFGNVTKELVDNWAKKADKDTTFYIFALNNFAQEPYNYLPNVRVLPANIMPGATKEDLYQRAAFVQIFTAVDFNVIYMLNDIEIVGSIAGDLKLNNVDRKKLKKLQHKTIFYFPIDSIPRAADLNFLQYFDEVVTFTEYGKNIIEALATPTVAEKVQVLPHGVNTLDFHQLTTPEIKRAKVKLFGEDKYVVGTVNRNSARKDIANTILGFYQFYNDWKNVPRIQESLVLYCHCNPEDVAGPNLRFLIQRLGLVEGKQIFFPKNFSENKGFAISDLNTIYNTFDCFITTTTAEGWGLTLTEAMAAKIPCIAPMHTSFVEITNKGTLCIPIGTDESVFVADGNKIRYKTSPQKVSKALHEMLTLIEFHHDHNKPIPMVEEAYKKVVAYNWKNTANAFWNLIQKYL